MKETDLRLENWVFSEYDGPLKLDLKLLERFSDEIEKLTPINLIFTHFIHLNAFRIKDKTPFIQYRLSRFCFTFRSDYSYWYVTDAISKTYMTKIQYVHELQNFFKSMDGIEIKLELNKM